MNVLCAGFLLRFPVGGFSWHHLQYLVGLRDLGHHVRYVEEYGWSQSCYDPSRQLRSADARYGIAYLHELLRPHGLDDRWCYLAEDGTAHGMRREDLAQACRECDLFVNIGALNRIPETELCRRRVLVDTDPVFTQIGHAMDEAFSRYHVLFTYGENVHQPGCDMPTAGARWLPTRQPVVLDLWAVTPPAPAAPLTTVTSWEPLGDVHHDGRVYGGKGREFEPFISLPREIGETMEMAVTVSQRYSQPELVRRRLAEGGWRLRAPLEVARTPRAYQEYLRASRGEFCVAKHGYVSTRCGWFSERSANYLASGRPVVVQDTGFSDVLPCGAGLLAYRDRDEAVRAIARLRDDYEAHCRAARRVAEEHFDSRTVLASLIDRAMR